MQDDQGKKNVDDNANTPASLSDADLDKVAGGVRIDLLTNGVPLDSKVVKNSFTISR